MSTFADIAVKQEALIRKALDGSAFRAPLSAAHIDASTLFNPDGSLAALPSGYEDVGLLDNTGMAWSRAVTNHDMTAFGRTSPVRSDVTADTDTMKIIPIETKRATIEAGIGATLTASSVSASNGSLQVKKPTRPVPKQFHWLSIAVDQGDAGEIYVCRYLPKGKITAYGQQSYGGDNPLGWDITVTGQNDSTWGGPSSWLFGGPGWNALLAQMGFNTYAPTDVVAPTVPSGVVAVANTHNIVTVSWVPSTDAATGVASYQVKQGGVVVGAAVVGTALEITGLSPSTAYSFTVNAVDYAGNRSADSTAAAITTPA